MAGNKLLVYLLRRDLRVSDNPILHHLATSTDHGFTHLLPVYVFPPHQIEVSGLLAEGKSSPYPPARSQVGKFWRCGPHRAKFITESVWDVKNSFESLNSVLVLRVGSFPDVLKQIVDSFKEKQQNVSAVWMTDEKSDEEIQEQDAVSSFCSQNGLDFKIWGDEKYYIDDRDNGLKHPKDLPDIFTTYRKSQEPLRDRPRASLPTPSKLPPPPNEIPPQQSPFVIPDNYQDLETKLLKPLNNILDNPFPYPPNASSAHPFKGGETKAWERVRHLIRSGSMTDYKETRNGLVGADFSTKLSGYLALGSITARQVHEELVKLEDGKEPEYKEAKGYNKGENEGTKAVRFELLWRDYMRLCSMKFGPKLFRLAGFRQAKDHDKKKWKTTDKDKAPADQDPSPEDAKLILNRFLEGRTGMGLIDASQRELYHTGYTSNRARQNVASFLSKHLYFDWRYGAEWYEMLLVDYDVSSNWSNWQYVAGVGNDPRGDARIFNPVKQAFDYDKNGTYVRTWVPELKDLEKLENVFQAWTTSPEDLEKHGLAENQMVTDPIKKIEFTVDRKPRGPRGPHRWRRGGGRGGQRSGWNESGGGSSPGSAGGGNAGPSGGRGNSTPGSRGQHNHHNNHKEGEMHQRHDSQQQRYDNAHVPRSMNNQYGGYNDGQSGYTNGYQNGYPNGGYNGYTNGYSDGYSNGYPNGYANEYPGPGTRGGWNGQSRGNGWRGSGGGRGNGFRRGYNNYIQHVPAPQGYAPHPSYSQPYMGPV